MIGEAQQAENWFRLKELKKGVHNLKLLNEYI
jgi:hypothetical protein